MKKILISVIAVATLINAQTLNEPMQKFMQELKQKAQNEDPSFKDFDYKRGEKIFTQKQIGRKGKEISCTSCHTQDLTKSGENISTGKVIEPLAPSANVKRFTKVKDVKKWLRRNFKDVYGRVGTAKEQGDVITYIINQK